MQYEAKFERWWSRIGFHGEPYRFPSPIAPKIFYFLLFYCFGGYRPFTPLFLQSINFDPTLIGLTLSLPPFISFLASPIWSGICDRYKIHKETVIACSICSALLLASLYVVETHILVIGIILSNAIFWSPLIPILDSISFKILANHRDIYGKQRLMGSIGFAASACSIGILAQHMNNYKLFWINYPIAMAFYTLSVVFFYYDTPLPESKLITGGGEEEELSSLQHQKQKEEDIEEEQLVIEKEQEIEEEENNNTEQHVIVKKKLEYHKLNEQNSSASSSSSSLLSNELNSEELNGTNSISNRNGLDITSDVDEAEYNNRLNSNSINNNSNNNSTISVSSSPTLSTTSQVKPSFLKSLGILLSNFQLLSFLLNAFIVSVGMSMNNNFLALVIVNDFHGPASLIGIGTVLNVSFELVFFFFGKQLMEKLGVQNLIIMSHIALIVRVLSYVFLLSIKANAWCILPIELLHGIVFASIWSAGSRVCQELAPPGLETTSQSLLFGVYLGLGMGIGALLGGSIYQAHGPIVMYTVIALMTIFGLILFLVVQKVVMVKFIKPPVLASNNDCIELEKLKEQEDEKMINQEKQDLLTHRGQYTTSSLNRSGSVSDDLDENSNDSGCSEGIHLDNNSILHTSVEN